MASHGNRGSRRRSLKLCSESVGGVFLPIAAVSRSNMLELHYQTGANRVGLDCDLYTGHGFRERHTTLSDETPTRSTEELDLSSKLRQAVKTHFSSNGELSHGSSTKEVHEGVQGRGGQAGSKSKLLVDVAM